MQKLKTEDLIPHPRNNEFFDDITGTKWDEFLQSIKTRGIIEPLIITQDNIVVSGHQRLRAAKKLNLKKIPCILKNYSSEDEILKDLIETNIQQRGTVGGTVTQIGNRIKELERLYGIMHGNNQHGGPEIFPVLKTQDQLAEESGMSSKTWRNYKQLSEAIPELKDLIDTKKVSQSTALAIMNQLSPEEQTALISSLDTTKKITKKEIDSLIEKQKELQKQLSILQQDQNNISLLIKEYPELQNLIDTGQVTPGMLKQLYDSSTPEDIQAFLKAINPQSHLLKQIEEKDKDIKRFKTGYENYLAKTSELSQLKYSLQQENDSLKQQYAEQELEIITLNAEIQELKDRPLLSDIESKRLFTSLYDEKFSAYAATANQLATILESIPNSDLITNTSLDAKIALHTALTDLNKTTNLILNLLKIGE